MSGETPSNPVAGCPQHPDAPAQFVCGRCQAAVCINCCYSMPDGSICCKSCLNPVAPDPVTPPAIPGAATEEPVSTKPRLTLRMTASTPKVEAPPIPAVAKPGMGCVQHPTVPSVAKCKICGARSCATCNFVFGKTNFCPVCASTSTTKLSSGRKTYLTTAYIMAGWSTLCLIILVSGILGHIAQSEAGEFILGIVIMLFMAIPAVIGTAMGMSAMRKGGNTMAVWIAMVWNSLIFGGLMLLIIIGMLSGEE